MKKHSISKGLALFFALGLGLILAGLILGWGAFWELEKRCEDLYGLFQVDGTGAPGAEEKRRISYLENVRERR